MNGSPWERGEPNPIEALNASPAPVERLNASPAPGITSEPGNHWRTLWGGLYREFFPPPIGSLDLGPVPPVEIWAARGRNLVGGRLGPVRTATDDEILFSYHGGGYLLGPGQFPGQRAL